MKLLKKLSEFRKKRKKKKKLYRSITRWLSLVLLVTFIISFALSYVGLFTFADWEAYLAVQEGKTDVIYEMFDDANEQFYLGTVGLSELLSPMSEEEEKEYIAEIPPDEWRVCLTDESGKVTATNYPDYIGIDLNALSDLDEETETFRKRKYFTDLDGNTKLYMYVVKRNDGYLVTMVTTTQIKQVVTDNSHTGANCPRIGVYGYSIIMDEDRNVISSTPGFDKSEIPDFVRLTECIDAMQGDDGLPYSDVTVETYETGDSISAMEGTFVIKNIDFFYDITHTNSIYIVCVYPKYEAYESLLVTIIFIMGAEILIFIMIFISTRIIVWRTVAKKIGAVNTTLGKIKAGDLDEKVDVRSAREFESLSDDINSMVDRLKGYIAEAEARIDADLAVAKEIQQSALPYIFPPYPEHREFELYATMTAAKVVGGDFHDFYMLDDNTLGFLIADVSGKSIPGAMFMMRAESVIKSPAESGMSAEEVFCEANNSLCSNNEAEMFVTAWLGYLELDTGIVHVANAGHNPPLLISSGCAEYVSMKPGLMLGAMEDIPYAEQQLRLRPGDMLFLYTDGVTEAMNNEENLYGEERLKSILSFGFNEPADEGDGVAAAVCRRVYNDVQSFSDGAEQSDDITMLCLKYVGRDKEQ